MHLLDKILDKNIDPEIFLALKNELLELDKLRQENHAYEIQNKVYFTRIEELSSVVSQQATQIKMNQFKIDQLIFDLARKKHLLYAAKNESMSAEQRTLFEEDFKTDIAAIEAELTELNQAQNSTPRQKEKPIRSALPAHLPRIKIVHEPASCTCEQCGDALVKIGEDISEKLDIKRWTHMLRQFFLFLSENSAAEGYPRARVLLLNQARAHAPVGNPFQHQAAST